MDAYVTLNGYVGSDITLRRTQRDVQFSSFRIGVTPRGRRNGEWTDLKTTWLTVYTYRGLADNVATSVRCGDPVTVSGKLRTIEWTDAEGELHERIVVEATSVGHDLTRGSAVFSKSILSPQASEPDSHELGDACLETEENAAQRMLEATESAVALAN